MELDTVLNELIAETSTFQKPAAVGREWYRSAPDECIRFTLTAPDERSTAGDGEVES